jgi:hypothetical protein
MHDVELVPAGPAVAIAFALRKQPCRSCLLMKVN